MTLETPGQVDPYEKSTFQSVLQVKRVQNTTTHTVWAPSLLSPPVYALSTRRSFSPNLLMMFWRSHQVHPNPAHAKNKSLEHHNRHFTSMKEGGESSQKLHCSCREWYCSRSCKMQWEKGMNSGQLVSAAPGKSRTSHQDAKPLQGAVSNWYSISTEGDGVVKLQSFYFYYPFTFLLMSLFQTTKKKFLAVFHAKSTQLVSTYKNRKE